MEYLSDILREAFAQAFTSKLWQPFV